MIDNDLYEKIKRDIKKERFCFTQYIQRNYQLNYPKASEYIDKLFNDGEIDSKHRVVENIWTTFESSKKESSRNIIEFEHHKTELNEYGPEGEVIGNYYIYCVSVKKVDKIVDDLNTALEALIDVTHMVTGELMWLKAKETAEQITNKSIGELEYMK